MTAPPSSLSTSAPTGGADPVTGAARGGSVLELLRRWCEHAARTLGVAVGGLLAIGVIGAGVVGQSSLAGSNAPLSSAAKGDHDPSLGVMPHRSGSAVAVGPTTITVTPALAASGGAGRLRTTGGAAVRVTGTAPAGTAPPSTTGSGSGGSPATTPPGGGGQRSGGSGSGGSGGGGGTGNGGGTSSGGRKGAGGTGTVIGVPGVVTVSTGDGTTSVSVLPGSNTGVAVCPDGISLSALGISVVSQCPSTVTQTTGTQTTGTQTTGTPTTATPTTATAPDATTPASPTNSASTPTPVPAGSPATPSPQPDPLTGLLGSLGL